MFFQRSGSQFKLEIPIRLGASGESNIVQNTEIVHEFGIDQIYAFYAVSDLAFEATRSALLSKNFAHRLRQSAG